VDVLRRSQVLHQVALEQLPEHDPFRTLDLTSCAVVGSAAGLKGGGAGTAIDKHTAVFRFNEAPTKSYEKDVGTNGLPPLPPVTSLHLLTAPPPQNLYIPISSVPPKLVSSGLVAVHRNSERSGG